jgi:hypothetical protein
MSKKDETQLDIDNKNQVAVTPEDVKECGKFFEFFEIPVPADLQASIDAFVKDPTLVNQDELRYRIANIIVTSKHPVFQDEVFAQVKPETSEENEKIEFERQLEETFMGDAEE